MTDVSAPFAARDFSSIRSSLDAINSSAAKVSKSLTDAFASAIVSGKSLDQTLQGIVQRLSTIALRSALSPVQNVLTSVLQQGVSGIVGGIGSIAGVNLGRGLGATPFADGGIVSRPTFFGANGGLGLMGERGAEAILPLARGPDGRLGVASSGGAKAANVTINITTPDAESFRRSQVQISGALARAVAHGQRGL